MFYDQLEEEGGKWWVYSIAEAKGKQGEVSFVLTPVGHILHNSSSFLLKVNTLWFMHQ